MHTLDFVSQHQLIPVRNLLSEVSKKMQVNQIIADTGQPQGIKINRNYEVLTYNTSPYPIPFGGLVFPEDRLIDKLLESTNPDIIQADEFYQPTTQRAYQFAVKNDKPLIINIRRNNTTGLKEEAYFKLCVPQSKNAIDYADKIICLCNKGKEWVLSYYPHIEDKIEIIPNALDPADYVGDGMRFRIIYRIPYDAPLVLNVSRIHPDKNIGDTILAFAHIKKEYPRAHLVLAGACTNKAYLDQLKQLISKLKLDNIIFTGEINHQLVKDAYNASDVVVLTSRREPFGYCVLEAFACSKPVVAYAVGGIMDMVEHSENGDIIPQGNQVLLAAHVNRLLSEPNERRRRGMKGHNKVFDDFHVASTAQKLVDICEGLI